MKKFIFFAGCSFTWGQGLWSYLETNKHVPSYEEYIYDNYPLPQGSHSIRKKLRFPKLVANHFGKTEIVKKLNGGTDEESIRFLHEVFDTDKNGYHLTDISCDYDDVEYIIFQTTQIYRSPFYFTHLGKRYKITSSPDGCKLDSLHRITFDVNNLCHEMKINTFDIFFDWMVSNGYNVNNFIEIIHDNIVKEIENTLKFFETKEIKTKIFCWQEEQLSRIFDSKFLSDRFIYLNYNGKNYKTIEYLYRDYPELLLKNDSSVLHNPGSDEHPSKKCHEIIADSIIKNIENNL